MADQRLHVLPGGLAATSTQKKPRARKDEAPSTTTLSPLEQARKDLEKLAASGKTIHGVDIADLIKKIENIHKTLPICGDTNAMTKTNHDRPEIDVDWSTLDQVSIVSALMLLENLLRIVKGGYEPGIIYRGTKKGEARTVVFDGSSYSIDTLTTTDLVAGLERAACFIRTTNKKRRHVEPRASVKAQVTAHHLPYPVLKALSVAPRWSMTEKGEFQVHASLGYDENTSVFVTKSFDSVKRVKKPTMADVSHALAVLDEIYGEFPFDDEGSRINILAFALTMALRNLFTTAPAFVISAEDPESGKTLLVETTHLLVYGTVPTPTKMAYDEGDQERRNLTAALRDTQGDVIWFDEPRKSNKTTAMVSDTLNMLLTAASGMYQDRPVYTRETLTLDVQKTLILTGNNLRLAAELERRSVRIMLRKSLDAGFRRTEDELRGQALKQHEAFHKALATLIDHWIAQGKPKPTERYGSFNSWFSTVGGILQAAGITGIRSNATTISDLYMAAKGNFLFWVYDTFKKDKESDGSVTVTARALENALTHPTNRLAVLALLEALLVHARATERATWVLLYDYVDQEKAIRRVLGVAMQLVSAFTTSTDSRGRNISMKRLESGRQPVRYRLLAGEGKVTRQGGPRPGSGRKKIQ